MVEAFLLVLALAALVAALLVAALVRHGWRAVARRPRRLPRGLFPAALCAAASGLPILAPAPAAAATIPPELTAELVNGALLVLSALAGWALRRAMAWLRVDQEGKLARRLEDGMVVALGYARERALSQAAQLDAIDVRSQLVADAAAYLVPKMPQTLAALGIDDAGLAERLTARLDQVVPLPALPPAGRDPGRA